MRIAVVGAYGNGKSTLSAALSTALGLPRVHATPMTLRRGLIRTSLEECDDMQLVQLVARRLVERITAEAAEADGFVSDGSVLHEFVYAATRFRYGLHPRSSDVQPRADWPKEAEILDCVAAETGAYAAQTYTAFVHVPNEQPLKDDPPPISEVFRDLLDARMLSAIDVLGVPVISVKGDQEQRLSVATEQLRRLGSRQVGRSA
jgi:hypothetical protein